MRTIKKKKSKKPNKATIKALNELDEMERNKEKYHRYDSAKEALNSQIKKAGAYHSGFKLLYLLSLRTLMPT